jgi:predicted Na+-dependent transporter
MWSPSVDVLIDITGSILLFCLVFGMSATVDITSLQAQLKNRKAISLGLLMQFVVLPFLGFLVVRFFDLGHATAVTLLVVTTSPGGSYSNWWCSMFNADLALSVTMTAISTLVSTVMMPLNLFVYTRFAQIENDGADEDEDVVGSLNWGSLMRALGIVILAIFSGLWASGMYRSTEFHLKMNQMGNFAGICLVLFSGVMSNTDAEARIYNRTWQFYVGVAAPCFLGLLISNAFGLSLKLPKPECVTIGIECAYQNVGIATSVALAMFDGDAQAKAVAVPFYYGSVEALLLLVYCVGCWKAGWTKAPADVSFWKMIGTSYEVLHSDQPEEDKDYHYVEHSEAEDAAKPSVQLTTGPNSSEKV